jgi:predicted nucleic acid-binding protein
MSDLLSKERSYNPYGLRWDHIDTILDALCRKAVEVIPHFRFRPFLDDPKDDLFIECALAANASLIVTDERGSKLCEIARLAEIRTWHWQFWIVCRAPCLKQATKCRKQRPITHLDLESETDVLCDAHRAG